MKRTEGIALLNKDGNLSVPCSRYGRDTFDCSPGAWRLAYIMHRETGEDITEDTLEHAMGLVVNDHDDVAYMIRSYGNGHYR